MDARMVQYPQSNQYHINKRKDRNHMIILIGAEKAIDKIPAPICDENFEQGGVGGNVIQHI